MLKLILTLAAVTIVAAPAGAQSMPTIDADGHLGSASVGEGSFHAVGDLALHNGDFTRGAYDDDAADLSRLPFSAAVTLGWGLHQGADGKADLWLEATSANGFHSPIAIEHTSPRAWYESNNQATLAYKPTKALTTALTYVVKTSPNGISPTSHELTGALGFQTGSGIGRLRPSVAVSVHTKGGDGVYTLLGINPTFDLTGREDGPTIAIPARFGIGWGDFYGADTDTATFGSVGLTYSHPFPVGAAHAKFTAQLLALIRDHTVRRLGEADAEHSAVVPLGMIGFSVGI